MEKTESNNEKLEELYFSPSEEIKMFEDIPDEEITDEDLSDEKLLSDTGESDVVLDALKQYLLSIGRYKLLTRNEEAKIGKRIEAGDESARELLTLHNLRLSVYVAKKLVKFARGIELLDLIQEGNMGLMRATKGFDTSRNIRFSTYAYNWIYSYIRRYIDTTSLSVHVPVYLVNLYNKYQRFRSQYLHDHGCEPPKELVMEMYNIKETTYQNLISLKSNVIQSRSLNEQIVNEDNKSEASTLEEFVPDIENGYTSFEDEVDKRLYMSRLKNDLPPHEYYIIYYRLLNEKPSTLEQIADYLGLTRERVRQLEASSIRHAKEILRKKIDRRSSSIQHTMKEELVPEKPLEIIKLSMLKEQVDEFDYFIYYHVVFKRENPEEVAASLGMSEKFIQAKIQSIFRQNAFVTNDEEYFMTKFKELSSARGFSRVYNQLEELEPSFNPIKDVVKTLQKSSSEEILKMLGSEYENYSPSQRHIIDMYLNHQTKTIYPFELEEIRAKIQAKLSHYCDSLYMDKKILYQVLLENKDRYNADDIEYLKRTYFKEESGSKEPPRAGSKVHTSYYLSLAERLYYDLNNIFNLSIPKKEIAKIINGVRYKFTEEEKEIISLRHGFKDGKEYSLKEIAAMYDMPYSDFHTKYRRINDLIVNIYLGMPIKNNYSNPERYAKYIFNHQYIMTDETREASRLYFLEGKTYKEIAAILGIDSTTKVSNLLTNAARKMDFWDYGMVDFPVYDSKLVENTLVQTNFTEKEKEIVKMRTIDGLLTSDIKDILKTSNSVINTFLQKFNKYYVNINGRDNVTKEDILHEVTCHISDSILNETERKVLALYQGIKCFYNPDGIKYNSPEASKMLGLTQEEYYDKCEHINYLLRARKIGFITPYLGDITYKEAESALKDPHIPITDYERELIASIKGIGRRIYTVDELAKNYGYGVESIARRIKRAYLTIRKYQAGEIEKKLIYEIDVEPQLKYFGEYNRRLLIMRYRDNMLIKDIAKAIGETNNSTDGYISNLQRQLLYFLKNPKAKKFDYDYARTVIHNSDLPFYGDFEASYKYYLRMSGEDGKRPNRNLNSEGEEVNNSNEIMSNYYLPLMIAVLKYRDGYRKAETIDVDELESIYLANRESYSEGHCHEFEKAIRRLRDNPYYFNYKTYSPFVVQEYIKARGENYFTFDGLTKSDAMKMLRNNPYHLSKYDLEKIRNAFGITENEILSGRLKYKVLKLITPTIMKSIQEHREIIEEKRNEGIKDASKYSHIHQQIVPPINANDIIPSLQSINAIEKKNIQDILITSPIVDLIFAHIHASQDYIDVLSMQNLYEYIYNLEKHILEKGDSQYFYNYFNRSIFSDMEKVIGKEDPKTVAFFRELFMPHMSNEGILKPPYNKMDMAAISPQFNSRNHKALCNRVKNAHVNFVQDIPDKFYNIINVGDEIRESDAKTAREIILEYEDYLINSGYIISYLTDEKNIPEIFAGREYKVIDTRKPARGVRIYSSNTQYEKAVIMKKKPYSLTNN